MTWKKV